MWILIKNHGKALLFQKIIVFSTHLSSTRGICLCSEKVLSSSFFFFLPLRVKGGH